ncbi:MAG: phycobilisome rod-core linker polypeptide, partial [Cyanobacteria bacterium P01_A01_bin.135]
MTLPQLTYAPTSQNQRVTGFDTAGDEQPRQYSSDIQSGAEIDEIVWAAYRQIFNEQQLIKAYRQPVLESQLRYGQITVKDFIRGLLLSDSFRRLVYDVNSNYRFVELCIQRVLGRSAYGDRETMAWSTVLATQGRQGFIDALLTSDEYLDNFGDGLVPYQRRRILPQREQGDLPFARMARYDGYHLEQLYRTGQLRRPYPSIADGSAAVYRRVLAFVPASAAAILVITLLL